MPFQSEVDKLAAELRYEHDAPENARIREIQIALSAVIADVRRVPGELKAIDAECRKAAREVIETWTLEDLQLATPALRDRINNMVRGARQTILTLDEAPQQAKRLVSYIDNLTYAAVKDWSPEEYIRIKYDELRSAATALGLVTRPAFWAQEQAEILRLLNNMRGTGRRTERQDFAIGPESMPPVIPTVAHSNTQGT